MTKGDSMDPKGLIAEAYKITGITTEECKSIFLDWALSLPSDQDTSVCLKALLTRHAVEGHPMTDVLREGTQSVLTPRRRGGWRSRH